MEKSRSLEREGEILLVENLEGCPALRANKGLVGERPGPFAVTVLQYTC